MNAERQLLGQERLLKVLETRATQSENGLTGEIVSAVRRFENGAEQTDDTTVLVFQYGRK